MITVDSESIPVGFRFHPTDEEIVDHYLKSKILGLDSKVRVIPEVDICKREPWQLPDYFLHQFRSTFPYCSEIQANDHRWYFFCRRDVKNPNGNNRVNRKTNAGFWKPTGTDREIKSRDTDTLIGTKKTLVFYEGRVRNSKRTNWVIHEYHLNPDLLYPPKNGFVLCLLKRKKNDNTRGEVEPSSLNGSSPNDNFTPHIPDNNRQSPSSFGPMPGANHLASNAENLNLLTEDVWELTHQQEPDFREFFSEFINQQPQMYPEQGFSGTNNFLNYNGFSNNDHDDMQFQSDIMESVDDDIDIDQFLVNRNEYTLEDEYPLADPPIRHRVMAARRSEMPETHLVRVSSNCSLTKQYVNDSKSSSETDNEVVLQSRVDPIVKTLGSLNRQCRRENFGFLDDESGGSSPSSVNSDKPIEINCCKSTSPEFPVNITRTSRPQYELRSYKQGTAPGKLCVQEVLHKEPKQGKVRESSCLTVKHEGRPDSVEARETATKLPQKEKSIVVSNNDLGMAGGGGAKKLSLKPREQEESSGKNQKCGSNFVQTSLASSHGSSPPSDYAFNLLLGIVFLGLFLVFVVLDMTHRISSVFN